MTDNKDFLKAVEDVADALSRKADEVIHSTAVQREVKFIKKSLEDAPDPAPMVTSAAKAADERRHPVQEAVKLGLCSQCGGQNEPTAKVCEGCGCALV